MQYLKRQIQGAGSSGHDRAASDFSDPETAENIVIPALKRCGPDQKLDRKRLIQKMVRRRFLQTGRPQQRCEIAIWRRSVQKQPCSLLHIIDYFPGHFTADPVGCEHRPADPSADHIQIIPVLLQLPENRFRLGDGVIDIGVPPGGGQHIGLDVQSGEKFCRISQRYQVGADHQDTERLCRSAIRVVRHPETGSGDDVFDSGPGNLADFESGDPSLIQTDILNFHPRIAAPRSEPVNRQGKYLTVRFERQIIFLKFSGQRNAPAGSFPFPEFSIRTAHQLNYAERAFLSDPPGPDFQRIFPAFLQQAVDIYRIKMVSFAGRPDQPDPGKRCRFHPLHIRIGEFEGDKIKTRIRNQIHPDIVRMRTEYGRLSILRGHDRLTPLVRNMIIQYALSVNRVGTLLFLTRWHVNIVTAEIDPQFLIFRSELKTFQRNDQVGPPVIFPGKNIFSDPRNISGIPADSGVQQPALGHGNMTVFFRRIRFQKNFKIIVGEEFPLFAPVRTESFAECSGQTQIQIVLIVERLNPGGTQFHSGGLGIDQSGERICVFPDFFNSYPCSGKGRCRRPADRRQIRCSGQTCRKQKQSTPKTYFHFLLHDGNVFLIIFRFETWDRSLPSVRNGFQTDYGLLRTSGAFL